MSTPNSALHIKVVFRCGSQRHGITAEQYIYILSAAVAHLSPCEVYDHIRACLYTWAHEACNVSPDYVVFNAMYQACELSFAFVADDGTEQDTLPTAGAKAHRETINPHGV